MSVSRSVSKKVLAVETSNGKGAVVRRSIGSPGIEGITPFLMLEYSAVNKGAGFPDHPHRGQATVTYMLEGKLKHEDSVGHTGTVEAGGVQWMCAGKGIIHAEMPVHDPKNPPRGLQLWIDLPKKFKMADPSYQEFGPNEIPEAFPEGPEGPIKIRVISGISHGVESPVRPLGGCWYFHVVFKGQGTVFQNLPPGWTAFIYIIKGAIKVGNDDTSHKDFHTLVLSSKGNETGVSITGLQDGTELVLAAAEPLDQSVVQYGPFVMTTREEIQKTLMDYQFAQNGFEKAHTWQSKIARE